MIISNRLFTYPVLSEDTEDYDDLSFDVSYTREMLGNDDLSLTFTINNESNYLESLILKDYAEYVIHIECKTTAYRVLHKSWSNVIHTSIPISKLNETVELLAMIVLKKDFSDFYSEEWNADFEDVEIPTIKKGSILAYQNLPSMHITKDFEEFTNTDSIFNVYKIQTTEDLPMQIRLEENKIKIGLTLNQFELYERLAKQNDAQCQSILNAIIVFPALVYVFEELKQVYEGEEAFEKYRTRNWFVSLKNSYLKKGIDFEEEIFSDKKSFELAQEIMGQPVFSALGQISDILSDVDIDEEVA